MPFSAIPTWVFISCLALVSIVLVLLWASGFLRPIQSPSASPSNYFFEVRP